MRIVILTERPFPYGMASTNRLIAYARGMVDSGSEVFVLCTKPTEYPGRQPLNVEREGTFKGIRFKYTNQSTVRNKSAFIRILQYFIGFYRGKKELKKLVGEGPVDILFMGLSNIWFTWSCFKWSRKNNVLFVHERSEFPFIGISRPLQKFKLWVYLRFTCKFFDVIVVISKAIRGHTVDG